MKRRVYSGFALVVLALSFVVYWLRTAGGETLPEHAAALDRAVRLSPDYTDCCLPPNLAPLSFVVEESGKEYRVHVHGPATDGFWITSHTAEIRFPETPWHALLTELRGRALWMDLYILGQDDSWRLYRRVENTIAWDEIDSHVSYRMLTPIHVLSNNMGTYQRELTTFRQTPILESKQGTAQRCVNCHTYVNNDPDTMLLHLRGGEGLALLLVRDGQVTKVDAKAQFQGAPASYSAWHPRGKQIAISYNAMVQFFHTAGMRRDVFIFNSDLGIYDVASNTVRTDPKIADPLRVETFPAWSPDGKYLYFSSAPKTWKENTGSEGPVPDHFRDVRFDLMRVAYDEATGTWGPLETVLAADKVHLSILEPRVSPDGRRILVSMCEYGSFPVFQKSSDLYFVDSESGEYTRLASNSDDSDSWHSWSSNGRWIVFASKRLDGLFGRLFFAHVDAEGVVAKPFLLPQEDPRFYETCYENYNAPEFAIKAVSVPQQAFLKSIYEDATIPVKADPRSARPGIAPAQPIPAGPLE